MKKKSSFGCEFGRSMIEMLGVLAIVGVLSVGGISGFQKAMNKHKINQVTEELSQFINELLRYSKDWRQIRFAGEAIRRDLTSEVDFILPAKWERKEGIFYDSMGNKFYVQLRNDVSSSPKSIALSYRFNERDDKIKIDLCMAYYEMTKLYYADSISDVWLWTPRGYVKVYGNAYCGNGKKCLSDLTLAEMRANCEFYKAEDKDSSFFIAFPL